MKKFSSCLRAVRGMIRPFLGRVLITVFLGIIRIALSLVFVWVCKRLIDIATGVYGGSLDVFVGVLIATVVSRIAVISLASYVERRNSMDATNILRYAVFSHVLGSRWSGRETFLSGDTVNRLEEDIRVVVDVMVSKLPEMLVTFVQLLAASVYLLTLSPELMWMLIILMFVAVMCSKLFFRKIRVLSNSIRSLDASVQQAIQENLLNRMLVLTLFGIDRVLSKVKSVQDEFLGKQKERLTLNTIAQVSLRFGFMAGYAFAFLWGIYGIRDGFVTYGMMTAFLQLVNQIQIPMLDLSRQIPTFIHSISSVERIMELQELKQEKRGGDILFPNAPEVSVHGITFAYEGSKRKVFSDFSFSFPAGGFTVITGHTGSGKSTLVKILLALLEPSAGRVCIDGMPVSPDTRCNFMYVPQGNTLMSGTIRENLLLSDSGATEQQMVDALRTVAADFVFELSEGLDTYCSEDGAGLSEGQAQRVSIARALLHPGNVLILDESTSSLDTETENRLLENIYRDCHCRKTIIFISHRDAVMKYADAHLHLG